MAHPQFGYILVPLGGSGAPGVTPAVPQGPPRGGNQGGQVIPLRPVKTNYLVKEGNRDLWAERLAEIPDHPAAYNAPAGIEGYDAMEGRYSPESMQALQVLLQQEPSMRRYMMDGAVEMPVGRVALPKPRE